METLFVELQKIEYEEFKLQAALRGVDLDGKSNQSAKKPEQVSMLFRSPEEYEQMSSEEREKQTKEMMVCYQSWAGKALKGK